MKKIIGITMTSIVCLLALVECSSIDNQIDKYFETNSCPKEKSTAAVYETFESEKDVLPEIMPLQFEVIVLSQTPDGYMYSIWREAATDVLYCSPRTGGSASYGGWTVMYNPDTGKPMTLNEYMNIYRAELEAGELSYTYDYSVKGEE